MNLIHNLEKPCLKLLNQRKNSLPPETMTFNPVASPRNNLNPIGAKPIGEQLIQERYLHSLLNFIAVKNPQFFNGKLSPENFRFVYSENFKKTANINLTNLTITVSPKFFKNLQNSPQGIAILCHEISHIIRGHTEFIQPPQIALNNPKFIRQKFLFDKASKELQPERTAKVFKEFDESFSLLQKRFTTIHSGELEPLLARWKSSTGKEASIILDSIKEKLEGFANYDNSIESKKYLNALNNEKIYYLNLKKWQQAKKSLNETIDEILGEKDASLNWQEAEADILGFRMFIRAGLDPDDFTKILAKSLDRGDQELLKYLENIKNIKNYNDYKFPPRGGKSHPSPKWRIANLAIRELHLRYPNKYKELIEASNKNIKDTLNAFDNKLAQISHFI
jgi:hypothetical protein